MSAWFEPDDEIARRLEQTLRQEADAMSIPENFDQVADASRAARRQRTNGIVAGVAAGPAVVALGGGFLLMSRPPSARTAVRSSRGAARRPTARPGRRAATRT